MINNSGLGLTASKGRKILTGDRYSHYFESPKGDVVLLKDGDTYDTINLMREWVEKFGNQTKKFANAELKGLPIEQLCSKLEDWQMKHFAYRMDGLDPERPGAEEIHTPYAQWNKRYIGIDCDDFAIFASSCLTQLGIKHTIRKADYGRGWQHVYVIVPISPNFHPNKRETYYCIDPVLDGLNNEKSFTRKYDLKMQIYGLSGIGSVNTSTLMGVATGEDFNNLLAGLGNPSDKELDVALFNHLAKTFNVLNVNDNGQGERIISSDSDRNIILSLLNKVLKNWDQRDLILDEVKAKHLEAERKGLMSLRTEEGESLSGLWDKIKKGVSKTVKKVTTGVKNVTTGAKNVATNVVKNVAKGTKNVAVKVWEGVKKYNPVSLAMRKAIEVAMMYNYRGLATVTAILANKKVLDSLDSNTASNVRSGNVKLLRLYKKFEGDPNRFYMMASRGASKKPLFNVTGKAYKSIFGSRKAWEVVKSKGVAGLGIEPATLTATLTAGAGAIATITKIVSDTVEKAKSAKDSIVGFMWPDENKNVVDQNNGRTEISNHIDLTKTKEAQVEANDIFNEHQLIEEFYGMTEEEKNTWYREEYIYWTKEGKEFAIKTLGFDPATKYSSGKKDRKEENSGLSTTTKVVGATAGVALLALLGVSIVKRNKAVNGVGHVVIN